MYDAMILGTGTAALCGDSWRWRSQYLETLRHHEQCGEPCGVSEDFWKVWHYPIMDHAFAPSPCANGDEHSRDSEGLCGGGEPSARNITMACVHRVLSASTDYRLDSFAVRLLFSSALVPTFCSWALQAQDLTGGTLRTWPIGTGNAPTVGIDELDAELTLSLCEVASHVHLMLSFGLRS